MSSEDEDYMSDAFLAKMVKDVKPSFLVKNRQLLRQNEIAKKKQKLDDEIRQKHKPVAVVQKERLKEGLETKLDDNNKGFAMLTKMGYKAGSSLGSKSDGIKVPIGINLKVDRGGLGRESAIQELRAHQMEIRKRKPEEACMSVEDYRKMMSGNTDQKQIERDLKKCQRTCMQLDQFNRMKAPLHEWFWPQIIPKEESSDEEIEETPEEFTITEKLDMLRKFLRNSYFYCDWCGNQYENAQDMLKTCPGPTKDDH